MNASRSRLAVQLRLTLFLLFALALLCGGSARANLITKLATGTDLGDGASWGGSTPGAGDIAAWTANSLGAGLALQSPAYWGGIRVSSARSDLDISGNWGVITLGGGGIDMSVSDVNCSLEVPIMLNTNQIWAVNAGESLNVSGSISGYWNLEKDGAGTLTLSANNPITGLTTVNQGTLVMSGQIHYNENWQHLPALAINAGGTVVVASGNANNFLGQCNYEGSNNIIAGGSLQFDTAAGTVEAIERAFGIGSNGGGIVVRNPGATLIFDYFSDPMQFSIPAGAAMTLGGAGTGIMNKTITGYGGIVKCGSGTWALNQTNIYVGTTVVSNGTLLVNGSLWTGPVTVLPGATLGGTGTVPGNLDFLPGAQAQFTNGATATWSGTLTLNNNLVHLMLPDQVPPGSYLLATYQAGGSSGSFDSVPQIDTGSLPNGCTAYIRTDRGNVVLVVLPPPAPHLAIVSINGGSNAIAGLPFTVTLQAQDTNGQPWAVAANTPITLGLVSGYGMLSGNLTGTIPANANSTTITGVTYNLDESNVVIAATDATSVLQSGDSAPFAVNLGPATTLTLLSDHNVNGAPGVPLPNPLMVKVTDPGGNLVPDAVVTFALAASPANAVGPSLSVTNALTGADGIASSILTLGNELGTYSVTASLPGQMTNLTITVMATNRPWNQVWSDEFNYSGLPDSNKWNYESGYVRNGENEYYTTNRVQNACVTNGSLIITARKEAYFPPGAFQAVANYTSASLITLGKENWTYGRMEIRAQMPQPMGGVWTAFWAQGTNFPVVGWPLCGEMDIVEYVNWNPNPHGNAFWGYNGGDVGDGFIYLTPACYNNFHIYAMEWNTEELNFFYDNTNYYTIYVDEAGPGPSNPFRNPQYLILNFALGGQWGGHIYDPGLPQQYVIDYVRVYQQFPTWLGAAGDGLWSSAANWTNSVLPSDGARVIFANGISSSSFIDTALDLSGISFYETAGSNVIAAANGGSLVLSNGVSNYSTNAQSLDVPIVLATNAMFDADPGNLILAAGISNGGFRVDKTGMGMLTLGGPVNLLYDGSNAPLRVSQGALSLAGAAFTINTPSGSPLAPGVYPLILQTGGIIQSTGIFPAPTGSAIGLGQMGSIVISNNALDLVIAPTATVMLNVPVMQGNRSMQLTFSGINPALTYRLQANDNLATTNWMTLAGNVTVTNGLVTIIDSAATNSPCRFYRMVTP